MADKFLKAGLHHYNIRYVKTITCNGPKKECGMTIANTKTSSGSSFWNDDKIVNFVCGNLSECPVRKSGIWSSEE